MNTRNSGENSESSTKPYLLRAIHQWAVENNMTPQVLVAASMPGVVVPMHYVQNDQIVLNVHPQSVVGLELGNDFLWFSARFSGKSFEITIPVEAIVAIYARENGQGIFFQSDGSGVTPPGVDSDSNRITDSSDGKPKGKKKPSSSKLKLVK
ncbi:MAG: ClpXP protease specificity-enhancing factor [Gammaproteobacteria bacterium]|nr:ClpXP protease specificity-enhancing factor [Gammaproteobacteria bacterium]